MTAWETVIGLEVHAQLRTRTKIFCGCPTEFGAPPNTHSCPICTGQPGVLPVINREAVRLAVRASLALGCGVAERSQFARKNYFYPDLPKGYQISQFDLPLASRGSLSFPDPAGDGDLTVRILRLHMEEDAGKSVHVAGRPISLVDFNRAGVPLAEIVSEPDLRSPAQASAYLKEMRATLRACGVSDGNMEEGSFRCDANISIRPTGDPTLGTRVEIKNMNSFKHVRQALEAEVRRQVAVVEGGGEVVQETRLWDDVRGQTRPMRGKEEAHDYRYFPDPDLPPLEPEEAWVDEPLPLLPPAVRAELDAAGFSQRQARELSWMPEEFPRFAAFRDRWGASEAAKQILSGSTPQGAGIELSVDVIELVREGSINARAAKRIFEEREDGETAAQTVARLGLEQVSDAGLISSVVAKVLEDHPTEADDYRAGNAKVLGFLMGRCMRALQGKGDPQGVRRALQEALDG